MIVMSGGCGGGGGGTYSSDTPEAPLTSITPEDIENTQAIIDESIENVFKKDGKDEEKIEFEEFIERCTSYLKGEEAVQSVTYNDSLRYPYIDIVFRSGISREIGFSFELKDDLLDTETEQLSDRFPLRNAENKPNYLLSAASLSYVVVDNNLDVADILHRELSRFIQPKVNSVYGTREGLLGSLEPYDFIDIFAHGLSGNIYPEIERATKVIKATDELFDDICKGRIKLRDNMYIDVDENGDSYVYKKTIAVQVVTPKFIDDRYASAKLKSPIIYLASCSAFDGDFPDALIRAGAKAVIGYSRPVSKVYARDMGLSLVNLLGSGENVKSAISYAVLHNGSVDPYSKETRIMFKGNEDSCLVVDRQFKVVDAGDNSPVPYASVAFTREGNAGYFRAASGENGKFSVILPPGRYTVQVDIGGSSYLDVQEILIDDKKSDGIIEININAQDDTDNEMEQKTLSILEGEWVAVDGYGELFNTDYPNSRVYLTLDTRKDSFLNVTKIREYSNGYYNLYGESAYNLKYDYASNLQYIPSLEYTYIGPEQLHNASASSGHQYEGTGLNALRYNFDSNIGRSFLDIVDDNNIIITHDGEYEGGWGRWDPEYTKFVIYLRRKQ
jgi:hypothetical protein